MKRAGNKIKIPCNLFLPCRSHGWDNEKVSCTQISRQTLIFEYLYHSRPAPKTRGPTRKVTLMKINTTSTLAIAAAFAGLLGGTSARLQAQTPGQSALSAHAGTLLAQTSMATAAKHSCKGKNDCKGQGGGDAQHAGKNECKGQGACATDGSKPPKS
jgi:hypothetical protein